MVISLNNNNSESKELKYEGIGNRIDKLRKTQNLNKTEFAKAIGITHSHLGRIIKEESNPSETLIKNICITFRVTESWLKYSQGEMYDINSLQEYQSIFNTFEQLDPDLQKLAVDFVKLLDKVQDVITHKVNNK